MRTAIVVTLLVCASGIVPEARQHIIIPKRQAAATAPASPKPLPPNADTLLPATLHVRAGGDERLVVRTVERILVAGLDREWLFERNPRDRRRASATLVEHASRAIVIYDESDLRNMLGLTGWADVLTLTAEPSHGSASAVVVEQKRAGADPELLRPAAVRFPDYKVFELSDWLEAH